VLRAAVLGVGSMGHHHARVYREIPEIELVAVADPIIEKAQKVSRANFTRAYADYRELLERERPDIVSVAVPTEEHYQVALDALEAGCHVLVEKPITATEEKAHSLIERAAALNRKLMVGHIVRFDPAVQELRRRLEAGELGQVFQIRCRRVGPFPARIRDVGVVIDLATHDLDIIRYITGQEIVRVYAETSRAIHSIHEDILTGTVRLSKGAIGLLDVNWVTPTKVRELTITGEKGMFLVNHLTQDLFFYENQDALDVQWNQMQLLKGVSEGRMVRFPVKKYEPLKAELQAFAHAVLDDTPVPVSGTDGLIALRIARALVRSGLEHRAIEVR